MEYIITLTQTFALTFVIFNWFQYLILNHLPKLQKFICLKCNFFWIALIITFNIYTAAVISLFGMILDLYINSKNTQL